MIHMKDTFLSDNCRNTGVPYFFHFGQMAVVEQGNHGFNRKCM